jgi:hypothetical protein
MTHQPRVAANKSAEWLDLAVELDRWEEAGTMARLWWRDDDAVAPTPQLDRLLARASNAPLALAVIPADAAADLAQALTVHPDVSVLHHGWCHTDRAAGDPGAGKKSEYPAGRHPVEVADELDEGRHRLRALFGARSLPVFVPPWNRFAERFVPLLTEAGFTALSQMAPRHGRPPRGIKLLDVDVDVTDWRDARGFVGERLALRALTAALRREREGGQNAVGVLTHHLVMDGATEDFIARLVALVARHPGACWADARELLAEPVPAA